MTSPQHLSQLTTTPSSCNSEFLICINKGLFCFHLHRYLSVQAIRIALSCRHQGIDMQPSMSGSRNKPAASQQRPRLAIEAAARLIRHGIGYKRPVSATIQRPYSLTQPSQRISSVTNPIAAQKRLDTQNTTARQPSLLCQSHLDQKKEPARDATGPQLEKSSTIDDDQEVRACCQVRIDSVADTWVEVSQEKEIWAPQTIAGYLSPSSGCRTCAQVAAIRQWAVEAGARSATKGTTLQA